MNMCMFRLNTAHTTKRFGYELARVVSENTTLPRVISLEGELGAGKTTFMQGFAKGLGIRGRITSPTFLVFRVFDLHGNRFSRLFHFDLYRIKGFQELRVLGFKDILSHPNHLVVLEWGEKAKRLLPRETLRIIFKVLPSRERLITLRTSRKEGLPVLTFIP